MHKKERSRNPVTPDKIPTPLLFDMYSFQSERRLIYHTILYSFSVRYLLFGFTSFFFKYTYHEITKSANILINCHKKYTTFYSIIIIASIVIVHTFFLLFCSFVIFHSSPCSLCIKELGKCKTYKDHYSELK